jgi:hypothetical protein
MPKYDKCVCGSKVGELHTNGCDWEECPFCHKQFVGCNCQEDEIEKTGEVVSRHGLSDEQWKKWEEILAQKGRIPYGSEKNIGVDTG